MLKTAEKNQFDQLSGAQSTQKLIEIHNIWGQGWYEQVLRLTLFLYQKCIYNNINVVLQIKQYWLRFYVCFSEFDKKISTQFFSINFCCIFGPALGCCPLQRLVEIRFSMFLSCTRTLVKFFSGNKILGHHSGAIPKKNIL